MKSTSEILPVPQTFITYDQPNLSLNPLFFQRENIQICLVSVSITCKLTPGSSESETFGTLWEEKQKSLSLLMNKAIIKTTRIDNLADGKILTHSETDN